MGKLRYRGLRCPGADWGMAVMRPEDTAMAGGDMVADVDTELRDYFAAKAMQAYLQGGSAPMNTVANWAYQMADAMLKARES